MARPCRLALLGLVTTSLGVIRARAAEPLPPVKVVYRAPAECPGRQEFEARVRARTGKPGLHPEGGVAFELFEIDLIPSPQKTRGRVTMHARGAFPTVRDIQAASCDEAVDALALIVALTLDPAGMRVKPRDSAGSGASSGGAGGGGGGERAGRGAADRVGTAGNGAGDRARAEPVETEPEETEPDEGSADEADEWQLDTSDPGRGSFGAPGIRHLSITTTGLAVHGVTPEILPGLGLSLGLVTPLFAEPGTLLRLGVRLAPEQTVETAQGQASFDWISAHVALCPQLFALSARLALGGCLNSEFGRLQASGADTDNPASADRPWAAIGPSALVEWAFFAPLFATAALELEFPLFRDRYVLGPETVHQAPYLVGRAELGLGVRL